MDRSGFLKALPTSLNVDPSGFGELPGAGSPERSAPIPAGLPACAAATRGRAGCSRAEPPDIAEASKRLQSRKDHRLVKALGRGEFARRGDSAAAEAS